MHKGECHGPQVDCAIGTAEPSAPVSVVRHRMAITSVTPLAFADHGESADLEDVTHSCVPCGTAVIRTIRSISGDAQTTVYRT